MYVRMYACMRARIHAKRRHRAFDDGSANAKADAINDTNKTNAMNKLC